MSALQNKARGIATKYPGLRWKQAPGHTESHQVGSLVAAPIRVSRQQPPLIMGVVRVVRFVTDTAFAQRDALTVEQVANELGRVLPQAGILPLQPPESNEVYRSPLVRIELVKKINADVMAFLSKNPDEIHNLHHRVFEELVAELLIRDGWKVDLTIATCDGGYDVLAVRSVSGVGIQLLVQAKKYKPDRPVGVSAIRELYAVKHINHATKAMLATTSYVSKAAKTEFRDVIPWELEFREFQDLTVWLKRHE
jgi:HJR/Mrr/RecB family endonuclease